MAENTPRLSFTCDYEEGAHPAILKRLAETNFLKEPGYGYDEFSLAAKDKIREACGAPNAGVYFLIGGTKCGALLGEAVVIPNPDFIPHFFTTIKQHGALLAKGRVAGIQFETLFTDGLYEKIGIPAIRNARKIQDALRASGYELLFESPTNQIFVVLENTQMAELAKSVAFSFWEKKDDTHTVVRFATSWATRDEDADELVRLLKDMRLA